jgi:hypothetical protein
MSGLTEYDLDRSVLHDLPSVHDGHLTTEPGDHTEVVSDIENRGVGALPERLDQIQDAGLRGHVQAGGGLVQDKEVRVTRQCDGNRDPLLLPTAELVRVSTGHLGGVGQTYRFKKVQHPTPRPCPSAPLMLTEDFDDLLSDGENRVKRATGVLEHHGQPAPPEPAELALRFPQQILATVEHLTCNERVASEGAHDRKGCCALAGSRLSSEPEDPTGRDGQGYPSDREDRPARHAVSDT